MWIRMIIKNSAYHVHSILQAYAKHNGLGITCQGKDIRRNSFKLMDKFILIRRE